MSGCGSARFKASQDPQSGSRSNQGITFEIDGGREVGRRVRTKSLSTDSDAPSLTAVETARVDIVYRPLRIGFVMISTDRANYRKVARLCTAFWGGRYNPIIAVDRPEASQLVDVFKPDFLVSMGDDPSVAAFVARYPYLSNPLFPEPLFFPPSHGREGNARVLDFQNLIVQWRETGDWKRLLDSGVRFPRWADEDPLADVFLSQFGAYPDAGEVGVDYASIFAQTTMAVDLPIPDGGVVPAEILDHPGPSHLGRFALDPHYTSDGNWIYPGIYAGNGRNDLDLLNFWNLRACGIALLFHDLASAERTAGIQSVYLARLRANLAGREEFRRQPALWSREETSEQALRAIGETGISICRLSEASWNGLNIRPHRMHFGSEAALGVMGGNPSRPTVRFALKDKPFSGDVAFYQQHLVGSVSLIGGQSDGTDYTFLPPCVPELNEFAARAMHHDHRGLRVERESVGVVIDAADHDLTLTAISVPSLIERIFGLAGFNAKLSGSGLIARQLITRMCGVGGARAFKIPGVRRLLKTHGPNASFTRKGALQLIGQPDPLTGSTFDGHKRLFIEARDHRRDLTPTMVFSHLVEKGLFRIGVDLTCPACALTSWTSLDALNQQATCPLCGNGFDATRQLVEGEYAYRRSGVLGLEKNTQGAVPVLLLLQQLSVNLMSSRSEGLFGASYDLLPQDSTAGLPTCEIDFCVVLPTPHSDKATILIGECKDAGGAIDANDIDHLRQVADAFPAERFDVYILLAKLAAFTPEEIALARTLNGQPWTRRAIMLSARELEPYHLFERTKAELKLDLHAHSAEELAKATHTIYFAESADAIAEAEAAPAAAPD